MSVKREMLSVIKEKISAIKACKPEIQDFTNLHIEDAVNCYFVCSAYHDDIYRNDLLVLTSAEDFLLGQICVEESLDISVFKGATK